MFKVKAVRWSDNYILGMNWYIVRKKPFNIVYLDIELYMGIPEKSLNVHKIKKIPSIENVDKTTDTHIEEYILDNFF